LGALGRSAAGLDGQSTWAASKSASIKRPACFSWAASVRRAVLPTRFVVAISSRYENSAREDPAPDDLVFGTRTGNADARHNVRRRVLLRAVERANENLATVSAEPLPTGLSPHALRRSFASWLVAEGEDPAYVMAQLGHTDPKMTLELYARALTSKSRRADRALPGDIDSTPVEARQAAV
jgi:integrase